MKICMGCMKQMAENAKVCPHCGFDLSAWKQESYYLKPESILGSRYIVGHVLNYSGYTVSYLGLDAEIGRKVIIKEYLPSDFSTRAEGDREVTIYSGDAMRKFEQGLINFLNEANRIQQLKEIEGIAKVYDCFSENDTGYVISEYIEGHTLKQILDAGKIYSPGEAAVFISQILRGLCLVHPLDIIHCDISPDTIMLADSGEIKLLDFGATRYVTTENSKSLAIILKQGYAPEEQYRAKGVRGPWTDVYALGAVMYRMITGIVPQESVERTLEDEVKAPSKLGIAISDNLENALMNALNVYQEERTPSAEMFLHELNSSVVKRVQTQKKKWETGKFPLWAKWLVACLSCLVVIGGIVLYNLSSGENINHDNNEAIAMKDLTGETEEQAEQYIKKLNEAYGWNIVPAYRKGVFDVDMAGKIYDQSVQASTDLRKDSLDKKTGLRREGKKISGEITFFLYRNDKIRLSEVKEIKNASVLSLKMDKKEVEKNNRFHGEKEYNSKKEKWPSYYDIKEIVMKDGMVYSLCSYGKDKSITVSNIEKVVYYAKDFFYWPKPEFVKADYKGKNINSERMPRYKMQGNKKQRAKKGYLRFGSSLIQEYYSFGDSYKEGDICQVNIPIDKEVDEREDRHIFGVIRYNFSFKNKIGDELERKIKMKFKGGRGPEIDYEGNPKNKVATVKINNKKISYFTKEDMESGGIHITIITKATPKLPETVVPNFSNNGKKVKPPSHEGNGI